MTGKYFNHTPGDEVTGRPVYRNLDYGEQYEMYVAMSSSLHYWTAYFTAWGEPGSGYGYLFSSFLNRKCPHGETLFQVYSEGETVYDESLKISCSVGEIDFSHD